MDNEILAKVNEQICKQFPYLKDIAPSVKDTGQGLFHVQYSSTVQTANDRTLPIIVNVVVDEKGNIKKLTTSR